MAVPAAVPDTSQDDFTRSVKRNITTVASMRGLRAKEVAERLGWSEQKFSQRMTGHTRWLAHDLALLARTLDVSTDVLVAQSDDELRKALSNPPFGYKPDLALLTADSGQMEFPFLPEPQLVAV